MRARKKAWTEHEIETNERIIKNAADHKGKWSEYFGNCNPIHIEIGCGKGRFIVQTASMNPNINYLAFEREEHVIVMGARASTGVPCSLGFIIGDVSDISDYFNEGELDRLYINFCDPWPRRKKWHKRRLTHSNFLNVYKKLLKNGSGIHFKTDNKELYEFSLNSFSDNGWRLKNITLDLHNNGFEGNVVTEYEEKFASVGMPIYRCEAYNV
ncbi:MAG: tRNA (guanosine(46)-N7)-methyltransferase TrmB [Defluviitaleaceae bacterium]|nr:tRNA (guanosine(46)-N7)-methyltransferase TrmB [Defluviitaleaceae bacterium]